MIDQGTDSLSQGDTMTGFMGGADVLYFAPLALMAVERQDNLGEWVNYWWGKENASWLGPEDWFGGSNQAGHFIWAPAPAAADVALEQL
jgi:hypothetical protein